MNSWFKENNLIFKIIDRKASNNDDSNNFTAALQKLKQDQKSMNNVIEKQNCPKTLMWVIRFYFYFLKTTRLLQKLIYLKLKVTDVYWLIKTDWLTHNVLILTVGLI